MRGSSGPNGSLRDGGCLNGTLRGRGGPNGRLRSFNGPIGRLRAGNGPKGSCGKSISNSNNNISANDDDLIGIGCDTVGVIEETDAHTPDYYIYGKPW